MKKLINPAKALWPEIGIRPALQREGLDETIIEIFKAVESSGDKALKEYTRQYDKVVIEKLEVTAEEIAEAAITVDPTLKIAIELAKKNIATFHQAQLKQEPPVVTAPGVTCWRKNIAIEKVGLYIPGGSAPLFSTLLMLAIPAQIAGCSEIVLTTPPDKEGKINPVILYTASLLGVNRIFKVGGAQAIAALTFGTESIPKVNKIFGPGNQYVTRAKELAQLEGVAIDMPAGPSEVLVVADSTSNPDFVAADLLSQAEHGPDSQVIVLSNSEEVVDRCLKAVVQQIKTLPRQEIAQKALEHSKAIVFDDLDTCMRFSNFYAPEHLILAADESNELAKQVVNAGSVFLGHYSCESAGDYASGTNHALPTNGYARAYSGVSTESFMKKVTFQELTAEGIAQIGEAIETMAEAEGLAAHSNAVTVRLNALKNV